MSTRRLKFKAETRRVLDLVIHSLYSHHDIFLRELISNASDALDRLRFEALTDDSLVADDHQGRIELIPDRDAKTLTVRDNGIGMDGEEMARELGTIASSGSRSFARLLEENRPEEIPELIGQFGVGFYSAFMVADTVEVLSRKAGTEQGHRWRSQGEDTFTVKDADDLPVGTSVVLHLREDREEYLEGHRLRGLVSRYSDYITYPIVLVEDGEDESPVLNTQKPIWTRPEDQVSDEEYNEFYKHLAHATEEPLDRLVYHGEGMREFYALLFLPRFRQMQMMMPDYKSGVSLYVRKVMIKEEAEELLPRYLRFVRGVVESSDLPLNISRELLQNDATVRVIRKALTRKVLSWLGELRDERTDDYRVLFGQFGDLLKEGVYSDYEHQEELADLLLVHTSGSPDDPVPLRDLVEEMPDDVETLYYVTGEDRRELAASPYLEKARREGREVLLFDSPVDEIMLGALGEYRERKLVSLSKESDEDLTDEELERKETAEEAYAGLLEYMKDRLEDRVSDVRFSPRLQDSPCVLISDRNDPGEAMRNIMLAMKQDVPDMKRILELNPNHDLIERLDHLFENDRSSPELQRSVEMLYDLALIMAGGRPDDPATFGRRVADLLT
jgi:molecular chaperone HtpG